MRNAFGGFESFWPVWILVYLITYLLPLICLPVLLYQVFMMRQSLAALERRLEALLPAPPQPPLG